MKWTADDIPSQQGRIAVITGANSGLGRLAAIALARHGAEVVIAARSVEKGEAVAAEISAISGAPTPRVGRLDLSDLASVRAFAATLSDGRVDLLLNNAGVMMTPQSATADGFELQFGTNHLGHFALTGLLLDALARSAAARVVTVSSNEHKAGKLDFDDLDHAADYNPRKAYQASKLANAIFAIELDRRLRAAGSSTISVFAHPGYAATNLQSSGPTGITKAILAVSNKVIAQAPEQGVLPVLYAATAADVEGGDYIGPDGIAEMRGSPKKVRAKDVAYEPEIGARLWEVSERLTGVAPALAR